MSTEQESSKFESKFEGKFEGGGGAALVPMAIALTDKATEQAQATTGSK